MWRRHAITALLLCAPWTYADPVAAAADQVLAAHRAGRDLRRLAAAENPDPWVVAEELCSRGEHDAAAAFAKAAPRKATENLPAYVESRRREAPNTKGHEALVAARKAMAAKDPDSALAALASMDTSAVNVATAWALFGRGTLLRQAKRFDESAKDLLAAGHAAERIGWLRQAAVAFFWAAMAYNRVSDPRAAASALERRLAILETLGNDAAVPATLGNLGMIYLKADEPAKALDYLQRSLRLKEQRGDRAGTAVSLVNLGLVQRRLGDYARALQCQERARQLAEALGKRALVAACLINIGNLQADLGDYRQALDFHQRGGELAQSIGHRPYRANALLGLGRAHARLGAYATALDHHRRCLQIREEQRDRGGIATSLADIGVIHMHLGQYTEALDLFGRSLRLARELGRGSTEAYALSGMGVAHEKLGQTERAIECQRQVVGISDRLRNRSGVAAALGSLGRLYLARGDFAKALEHERRALELHEELGEATGVAITLGDLGFARWRQGEYSQAERHYRRALDLFRKTGAADARFYAVQLGRMLAENLDRPAEAVSLYEEAIATLEEQRRDARGFSADDRAALATVLTGDQPFVLLAQAQLRLEKTGEALAALERGRARGVLDLLARSRIDALGEAERRARVQGDDERLRAIGQVRLALEAADKDVSRLSNALGAQRKLKQPDGDRMHALQQALQKARATRRGLLGERALLVRHLLPVGAPGSLAMIQRALGPKERLLFYAVGETGSALFVVPPSGGKVRALDLGVALPELTRAVGTYLPAGPTTARGVKVPRRSTHEPDAGLYDALVPKEIRAELADLERIYLIPHGPLHRLPFEALRTGEKTYWLDTLPPVAYGHSGSVLLWCKQRRDEQRGGFHKYDVVALGDPVFADLERLPGTRREVESIATGKVARLLGEEATKERLFALAPQGRYLHLATHQLADETEHRGYSRLALSDGGYLSLFDLFEHWRDRLSACELVVLSACETVKGPAQSDEGPYAMPLGFLYAGAPAVIGSLWRVDDQSTADLFRDFYRRLAEGQGKLEAFTAARKELRKKHPQPRHWAAFVYIGDPR